MCSCENKCSKRHTQKRAGCPCRSQNLNCTANCTCGKKKRGGATAEVCTNGKVYTLWFTWPHLSLLLFPTPSDPFSSLALDLITIIAILKHSYNEFVAKQKIKTIISYSDWMMLIFADLSLESMGFSSYNLGKLIQSHLQLLLVVTVVG